MKRRKINPKLEEYIVVCVDMLGHKEACLRNKKKFLSRLVNATNSAYAGLNHNDDKESGNEIAYYRNWKMKTYSDNILLALPRYSTDSIDSQLGHIFHGLASFQLQMIDHGFFVRGGIGIGDFYQDDNIAFGPALIKAHEAESQIANYPRIILDQSASTLFKREIKGYGKGNYHQEYIQDFDGQYFLNYLKLFHISQSSLQKDVFHRILKMHKQMVEDKLREFAAKQKIWGKYMWVAKYHNKFCHEVVNNEKSVTIDIAEFLVDI